MDMFPRYEKTWTKSRIFGDLRRVIINSLKPSDAYVHL